MTPASTEKVDFSQKKKNTHKTKKYIQEESPEKSNKNKKKTMQVNHNLDFPRFLISSCLFSLFFV
jgi:hypothetical protein